MARVTSLAGPFRRLVHWIGAIARGRCTFYVIVIGTAAYGAVLRCSSLGRSLWLDEAWVANSVTARSLGGMFYYDSWLQSSPPIFLLLVRTAVAILGLRNSVLRAVPAAMGILAVALMLFLAVRILWRQYALLAWSLLVLSPLAVDYSRQLKQYSSELATTTAILLVCVLYIEKATPRRFWLLTATVVIGLLSAYATAFLLPGLALAIWMSSIRDGPTLKSRFRLNGPFVRALVFAAIAGGALAGEYWLFVIPNSPAILRTAWAKKNAHVQNFAALAASETYQFIGELPLNHRLQSESVRLTAAGLIVLVGLALAWLRFRAGRRKWFQIQVVCLLPCLLLVVCDLLGRYPFRDRTSLFALPCLIVLLISGLQLMSLYLLKSRRNWVAPWMNVMILGAIGLTLIAGRAKNHRFLPPTEDMDGAVSYLQAHVRTRDFLWVHASCSEAFKLCARMANWQDAPVRYGHTGWPCCARGITNTKDTSSEALVRADFGNALPRDFSGKVWLLYTTRPEHWKGFADEPHIMEALLLERGCTEDATPSFIHLGVDSFDCKVGSVNPSVPSVPHRLWTGP